MKKFIVSIGLAAALLSAPLANATPIQDRVAAAVAEYATAYTQDQANMLFNAVVARSTTNAPIRFDQFNDQTSWYINGVLTHNITYDRAISELASQTTDAFEGYHYQNNSYVTPTGEYVAATAYRIKIVTGTNSDGSFQYFNEDWINAGSVTQLIVGIAEESFQEGYSEGYEDGYISGYGEGYQDGFIDGFNSGFSHGIDAL